MDQGGRHVVMANVSGPSLEGGSGDLFKVLLLLFKQKYFDNKVL